MTIIASDIKYEIANHDGIEVIFIRFPYDKDLVERVKKLTGAKWSQRQKAWYVLDTPQYREKFKLDQRVASELILSKIDSGNLLALAAYVETLELKAYSKSTINTYKGEFIQLLGMLKSQLVSELTEDRLRSYFHYCIKGLNLSENTIHNRMNAVKFYFEQVLGKQRMFFDIPRPKK